MTAVVAIAAVVSATPTPALADVSRCSDQKVEYLVGGKGGASGRTCAASSAFTAPPAGNRQAAAITPATARPAGPGPVMKADDSGRREILEQELQKERLALADLDKTRAATPGAGSFEEQRNRRLSDIAALESELRRIPGS